VTVVGTVVVMGLLGLVLLRTHAFWAGCFLFAAVWGFLLGTTAAGPVVGQLLHRVGASLWQLVTSL